MEERFRKVQNDAAAGVGNTLEKCETGFLRCRRRWEHFGKCRNIDAAAEAARGLVTSCESDAQGGEELGAEINLISASDSLPLENPPLLRQSLKR